MSLRAGGGLSSSTWWGAQVEQRDAGELQRADSCALRNGQDLDQQIDWQNKAKFKEVLEEEVTELGWE